MNIQDKYGDSDDENSINSESDNESEDSVKDDYDDDYDEEVEVEKYGGGDKENEDDDEDYEDNGIEDVENIDINLNVDDDEDDEDDEKYLQKFNNEVNRNYLIDYHPECIIHNYDEIMSMTKVVRDKNNNIIDDLHKTLPYLTKYEKARILGQRAKQINSKAKVFVKVPDNVIDGYLIAQLELKEKRIPFIIRRPLPSGGCEYWSLKDLEIIDF